MSTECCQPAQPVKSQAGQDNRVDDRAPAPKLLGLSRNAKGELVARVAGREEPVVDVRVARCFPWSLPGSMVSVRDKDGKEIILLETLDGVPEPVRRLIEDELREKVFAPQVRKFLSFEERFGITTIKAATDRGEVTFQLRNRDDVRVLSPIRCVMKDVDGNIYEVRDARELDSDSRKHLEDFF